MLLKCLNQEEAKVLMGEVHEGICGAHQSAYKMKWIIRRAGYFWQTILEDCFEYYKGCQDCQCFGNVQKLPASAMNPIIKQWPFWGWVIDLIGQIFPLSSKWHKFILVAIDYFTKWVEAIPLKMVTSKGWFCQGAHCVLFWDSSNYNYRSRDNVHIRGVRRFCCQYGNQATKFFSLLCLG